MRSFCIAIPLEQGRGWVEQVQVSSEEGTPGQLSEAIPGVEPRL